MMLPATQNLPAVYRNSDYVIELKLVGSNNEAINLSDYQGIYASVWATSNKVYKLADFDVSFINAVEGHIQLSLTDQQTRRFSQDITTAYYDVLIKEPNGDQYYWLKGNIPIKQGYSTPTE